MTGMERKLARGRWAWYIGAVGSMVGYLLLSGLVKVDFGGAAFEEDDEEEEEERIEEIAEEIGPEAEIIAVEVEEPQVNVEDIVA
jgi:hypothetical protein